jgi:hypothetical protein
MPQLIKEEKDLQDTLTNIQEEIRALKHRLWLVEKNLAKPETPLVIGRRTI